MRHHTGRSGNHLKALLGTKPKRQVPPKKGKKSASTANAVPVKVHRNTGMVVVTLTSSGTPAEQRAARRAARNGGSTIIRTARAATA